ncbi:Detected protein of confused Function [Hibiscus syriacus]|uniref:Detected protein of confused Function n=1 Tax=Hibiscus syriacus TaxID=106335 RepID=A0A6A2ZWX7_HIBSY|nr:Detected protein of confused Function [Hibiscus syriacus]
MDHVPSRWKGICTEVDAFNAIHCNRKIIGARYFTDGFTKLYVKVNSSEDYISARDADGHGSHKASIAAGRRVKYAAGIGGACWAIPGKPKSDGNVCVPEDILAAFDAAIGDGVAVLSVSIGLPQQKSFDQDVMAIGSLHALSRNIITVCAAGNSGPNPSTLTNVAPWIITVGASSIDRRFYSPVYVGNGVEIPGYSMSQNTRNVMYPLVYASDAALPGVSTDSAGYCLAGSLDPFKVNGKIVVCFTGSGLNIDKGIEVSKAGGVGMILANSKSDRLRAVQILQYIYSTMYPTATIMPVQSQTFKAPLVAPFSSRGPNHIDPYILKPDIIAPGFQILAAWSLASSPTKLPYDQRHVKYNIFSGTSMACPHVSGVVTLLRAVHPDWSISAIKSAVMTTATLTDNSNNTIEDFRTNNAANPFDFGTGNFRPVLAADPGLVYDASYEDYLLYLCAVSPGLLSKENLRSFCPSQAYSLDLNYPSVVVANLYDPVTVSRTVTNACNCQSKYTASWYLPAGIGIIVNPDVLYFDYIGQKQKFTVTFFRTDNSVTNQYVYGWFMWNDGLHYVRSVFAVFEARFLSLGSWDRVSRRVFHNSEVSYGSCSQPGVVGSLLSYLPLPHYI